MFELSVDQSGTVKLTGVLTITGIEKLHSELVKIIDDDICTALDCAGVTTVDTAALQVLVAFKMSLAETKREVSFITSPAVQEALLLTGLKKLYKDNDAGIC